MGDAGVRAGQPGQVAQAIVGVVGVQALGVGDAGQVVLRVVLELRACRDSADVLQGLHQPVQRIVGVVRAAAQRVGHGIRVAVGIVGVTGGVAVRIGLRLQLPELVVDARQGAGQHAVRVARGFGGAVAGVVQCVVKRVAGAIRNVGQAMRGVIGVLGVTAVRLRHPLDQTGRPVVDQCIAILGRQSALHRARGQPAARVVGHLSDDAIGVLDLRRSSGTVIGQDLGNLPQRVCRLPQVALAVWAGDGRCGATGVVAGVVRIGHQIAHVRAWAVHGQQQSHARAGTAIHTGLFAIGICRGAHHARRRIDLRRRQHLASCVVRPCRLRYQHARGVQRPTFGGSIQCGMPVRLLSALLRRAVCRHNRRQHRVGVGIARLHVTCVRMSEHATVAIVGVARGTSGIADGQRFSIAVIAIDVGAHDAVRRSDLCRIGGVVVDARRIDRLPALPMQGAKQHSPINVIAETCVTIATLIGDASQQPGVAIGRQPLLAIVILLDLPIAIIDGNKILAIVMPIGDASAIGQCHSRQQIAVVAETQLSARSIRHAFQQVIRAVVEDDIAFGREFVAHAGQATGRREGADIAIRLRKPPRAIGQHFHQRIVHGRRYEPITGHVDPVAGSRVNTRCACPWRHQISGERMRPAIADAKRRGRDFTKRMVVPGKRSTGEREIRFRAGFVGGGGMARVAVYRARVLLPRIRDCHVWIDKILLAKDRKCLPFNHEDRLHALRALIGLGTKDANPIGGRLNMIGIRCLPGMRFPDEEFFLPNETIRGVIH